MPARNAVDDRGSAGARPVLLALDGSRLAERALPYAVALARERAAPLLLVRVVEISPYRIASLSAAALSDVLLATELPEAQAYLRQQAMALPQLAPGLAVQTELRSGDAALELLDAEQAHEAQLLVLTTHGRTGVARWLRGSVVEKLLRQGRAPVFLVRPWDDTQMFAAAGGSSGSGRRVVVALDGSALAEKVLAEAGRLAGAAGELVLATVVPPPPSGTSLQPGLRSLTENRQRARAYLEWSAGRLRERGVSARPEVLVATDVAGAIADLALGEQADLIALSTHGRGSVGRLLYGSVADRLAHLARVPLLLCRPPAAVPASHSLVRAAAR
jgi:nucleotide-binding universal stress UspA family protein